MSDKAPDLFSYVPPSPPPPPPFVRGSATSERAAGEIRGRATALRERVLAFLRQRGPEGATDEEIATVLGLNPSTGRPRRIELLAVGLVCDSMLRRETVSGRKAAVWVAKEHAAEAAARAEAVAPC